MKIMLAFLLILGIYGWEMYRPIPDFDREQFDEYRDKTEILKKSGTPQAVLIYYKIESVYAWKHLKKPPNPTELTSWINVVNNRKKLEQFDLWLKQSNE
jgi:hypothetical protein